MSPTVPTETTAINQFEVDNPLKSLIVDLVILNKCLQMLTNLEAGWRQYSLRQFQPI